MPTEHIALVQSDSLTSTLDLSMPFAACRLCGEVYQSPYDRNISSSMTIALSWQERRKWTYEHARTHSVEAHIALEESGELVTPIASRRLREIGIDVR